MRVNGVSIIICCYNSELLLQKTLQHITGQKLGKGLACEVILVDNASTDNTQKIAASVWLEKESDINFIITYEPKPGLSYARQKGINKANYEFLIFCDDDNWLDEHYVQNVVSLFTLNPSVAVLGGAGTAEFENPLLKPAWFEKFYHGYAVGPQAEKESILNGVYGAGMAIRKSVLKEVMSNQPFFLHGRKGNQLSSGEDGEICFRVRLVGYQILYSPRLKFKHFLTEQRLTWNYLKSLHTGFAKMFVVIDLYQTALISDAAAVSFFYWFKMAAYYWGIYLKYWLKQYALYKHNEGTIEEIRHLTWKTIALSYLQYNVKTIGLYSKIINLKKRTY